MRHFSDDQEYSQQLLDKSTEIWTQAAKKRQIAMQSLTPAYSRKQQVDHTNQSISGIMDRQLEGIKDKISSQKSASKQKDLEIETLKERIAQLNKDKQVLLSEIGAQEDSWDKGQQMSQNTLNFEKTRPAEKSRASKHLKSNKSQIEETVEDAPNQKLEDLPSQKLVQLVRSTAEYRNFVDYYDGHDLVFLQQFFDASRRSSRPQRPTKGEECSDAEIFNQISRLNEKQNMGLNYHHQTTLLTRVKEYYEKQLELRAKNMRSEYQGKLKKAQKEASIIPEDLKEICKIKEGQLAHQVAHKKGKSVKKKLNH